MSVYYDSAAIYIETATDLRDKITKIDAIITALEAAALTAAAKDGISGYELNDGQVKIRTEYKGTDGIYKSIISFERIKQMYVNKLNGRHMRLIDGKNFPGKNYGRF